MNKFFIKNRDLTEKLGFSRKNGTFSKREFCQQTLTMAYFTQRFLADASRLSSLLILLLSFFEVEVAKQI